MVFSSNVFLFGFLPVLLFCYFLAKNEYRNYVLLLFSLIFYAWGEPKFVFVMIAMVMIDYAGALGIWRIRKSSGNRGVMRLILWGTVAVSLGVLIYFKYTTFLLENVKQLLQLKFSVPQIVLPIGISFFTFQALSYVIDVYRDEVEVQKNPLNLLLYVSLFPQLIAGPIVRYSTVEKEIKTRSIRMEDIYEGIRRFILGFAKKLILANQTGELADLIYNSGYLSTPTMWLGGFAYMLQIFFDFSAYSDMAIGLGRIFGFHFEENFNYPYIAKSITDFWRRWHISLSTWFRDYVYIPLGGNRRGAARQIFNMFVVWSLTGIWHGAAWNFLLWGLFYFVFLVVEKHFLGQWLEKIPVIFRHLYTLLAVFLGWVLFRAESLGDCLQYIKTLFVWKGDAYSLELVSMYVSKYGMYLLLGCLFSMPIGTWIKKYLVGKRGGEYAKQSRLLSGLAFLGDAGLLLLFLVSVLFLVNSTYNPFIYFRF